MICIIYIHIYIYMCIYIHIYIYIYSAFSFSNVKISFIINNMKLRFPPRSYCLNWISVNVYNLFIFFVFKFAKEKVNHTCSFFIVIYQVRKRNRKSLLHLNSFSLPTISAKRSKVVAI